MVGADPTSPEVSAPILPSGGTIADALEAYFFPTAKSGGANWNTRSATFLRQMGGVVTATGILSNRGDVVTSMGDQIGGFACWYLVNRLRQTGRLSLSILKAASVHINGASREMAEVFVEALEYAAAHPGSPIEARGGGPSPSSPGSASGACAASITALEAAETASGALDSVSDWIEAGLRRLGF